MSTATKPASPASNAMSGPTSIWNRVVGRNPREPPSGSTKVANAGEREVAAGYPAILLGRDLKHAQSLGGSGLRVHVEGAAEGRVCKLQCAHQHQVAHHNQCLS